MKLIFYLCQNQNLFSKILIFKECIVPKCLFKSSIFILCFTINMTIWHIQVAISSIQNYVVIESSRFFYSHKFEELWNLKNSTHYCMYDKMQNMKGIFFVASSNIVCICDRNSKTQTGFKRTFQKKMKLLTSVTSWYWNWKTNFICLLRVCQFKVGKICFLASSTSRLSNVEWWFKTC